MNKSPNQERTAYPGYPEPELLARLLEQCAAFPDSSWIQGAEAQDAAGQPVYPFHETAVKFCAVGRLNRVCSQQRALDPVRRALSRALLTALPPGTPDLAQWNDQPGRQPEEVRALFRQTAAQIRGAA